MRITSGFDKKYGRISRGVLSGIALASVMMVVVAILGKNGSASPGPLQAILFPVISFVAAIWAYAATLRKAQSFHYFCTAAVVFALALYGYGAPWTSYALLGVPALLAGVAFWLVGERGDQMDHPDEF